MSRRHPLLLLVYVLAATLCACGGGGGDGQPPPPPPVQVPTASFQPASTPSGTAVTLNASSPQQNTFTVDVAAQSITNSTYGAAFDLDFDPNLLSFASHQAGTFFEQGGNTVQYQVATAQGSPGKLVIGVSLQGNNSGVTGSGRIIRLQFNIQRTNGTGNVAFSGNNLRDPNLQLISGISWSGGTVQVQLR